jgi:two-component sensor histidine kinase
MLYLSDQINKMYKHPLAVSTAVQKINTEIIKIHREMKDIVIADTIEEINESLYIINHHERKIYKNFELIEKRFLGDISKSKYAKQLVTDWRPIRKEVVTLIKQGRKKEAAAITKGKGARHVQEIELSIEELSAFASNKADQFYLSAVNAKNLSFAIVYFLIILVISISVIFAVYLTSSITRPIQSLKKAIKKVGGGQLDTEVDFPSSDELGELALMFNQMTKNLKELTTSKENLNKEINERKRKEAELKETEFQFKTLYELSCLRENDKKKIADFTLDRLSKMTKSRLSFLGFMNDDEKVLILHSWSKQALKECNMSEKPIEYPIEKAGLWGEAVRQRKSIIVNDYDNTFEPKKGLPEGHMPIKKLLCIPLFDEGKIVAVGAVANKETDYSTNDEQQMNLLLSGMWNILKSQIYQKELLKTLKEKDVLLQEVHHRVKNNLAIIVSFLELQTLSITDDKLKQMFIESKQRIKTMSLIHERLYKSDNFNIIEPRGYINSLTRDILRSFKHVADNINVTTEIEDIPLNISILIPVGLIINELVTNSIKYAFNNCENPELSISLNKNDDNSIILKVDDNGAGFDEKKLDGKSLTLGYKIIKILVNQINGNLSISGKKGVHIAITFKI